MHRNFEIEKIEEIEKCFKEVCNIEADFSIFPHTEIYRQERRQENSHLGEVWTPTSIVDKMILTSNPQPDKFNLDLCAGRGQFTVRMLRKFIQDNPDFDINEYLTQYHWFCEINEESCRELLYIFGNNINLAIGPAQELKSYPEDFSGTWKKGIFKFHKDAWHEVDEHLNFRDFRELKTTQLF